MAGRGSTGTGVAAGAAGGSAARRACVSRAARARDWRSTSAQRDAAVASWTIASGNRLWAESNSAPLNTDRKSTRLNSSHSQISYAVFCLKKKSLSFSLASSPCYCLSLFHLSILGPFSSRFGGLLYHVHDGPRQSLSSLDCYLCSLSFALR